MYDIIFLLYQWTIALASLFHQKARLLRQGHAHTWQLLQQQAGEGGYIWFHAASLGEFEQGRPLMERLRREQPEAKILLTFFSPSGYEVRKDYPIADLVCYLPFDTPANARRFVELVKPRALVLIKYEFWRNYINTCYRLGVPVYSVSSIFREGQIFFRPWGRDYARCLRHITHFYVQNEASVALLQRIGITQTTIVGDTRFDRVLEIKEAARPLPLVEQFSKGRMVLVVGSSWPADEAFILDYFNQRADLFLILAPHVVEESHLSAIEAQVSRPVLRLSEATEANVSQAHCLLIDGYGLLSSIYRYGQIAYIGGGFGVSIHNIVEAAVYGIPVLFGPRNKKFREAQDLKACGGGIEVTTPEAFAPIMDQLLADAARRQACATACHAYIASQVGATERVFAHLCFTNSKR